LKKRSPAGACQAAPSATGERGAVGGRVGEDGRAVGIDEGQAKRVGFDPRGDRARLDHHGAVRHGRLGGGSGRSGETGAERDDRHREHQHTPPPAPNEPSFESVPHSSFFLHSSIAGSLECSLGSPPLTPRPILHTITSTDPGEQTIDERWVEED